MARNLGLSVKGSSTEKSSWSSSQEEIARVAYELFERRGCAHGCDRQDWFEAERIVRQRRGNGTTRR